MKNVTTPCKLLPLANYETARARAVEWLGNRYLLAKPVGPVHRADVGRQRLIEARVVGT